MVLWILICSLTLKPVVYPVDICKTILKVILITYSSLQHILFPVQTNSVFSILKHYISKNPKPFFVLSCPCHEGRRDLGELEWDLRREKESA